MSKNIDHVQHIKSNVVVEGKPKIPEPSALVDGELAVNYATGFETISLKNSENVITRFSSDDYYTKQKLGSGFTGENSAKTVTEIIEDNELVWTNAYVTLSGAVSSHTANNDIHVTAADKTAWNNVSNKVDTSAFTAHTADSVVHITSAERTAWNAKQDKLIINSVIDSTTSASTNPAQTSAIYDFVTGYTPQITVEQTIDSGTSASTNAVATKAVYDFITNDFYTKTDVDTKLGSGFTGANSAKTVTEVIENNEEIIAASLVDLNRKLDNKTDSSAFTSHTADTTIHFTTGAVQTQINDSITGKTDTSAFTAHTADTTIHFTTGAVQTQIDNSISGKVNTSDIVTAITPSNSGSTNPIATNVVAENELTVSNALTDLSTNKADKSTTYTKTEIDDMIGNIETLLAAI